MVARLRAVGVLGGLGFAAVLGFGACGDPDPYDTSCKADGDCVVVPSVKKCGGCPSCGTTVINASELDRYQEYMDDQECPEESRPCSAGPNGNGTPCAAQTGFCSHGKCAIR